MTMHWTRACLAVLLATALGPAAASAQMDHGAMQGAGRPTISASGMSTVQRKPTQLRLNMQLLAKGKTLADALAKLKERQEAAAVQLETLKADKKSIVFGAPSLSNDQSSRKRQIQAMVIAQMRARGKKVPKGLLTPQTVTVSATLTAQWPLGAESHEKLLLLSQGIEEKIKAADLAGSKEAEKLSPEEEEFEEEASQMANQSGEEAQRPGQPQFMFVAELPKQERQKAMAAAFAKAKERAAELAKAADVELGPLVGLTGNCFAQSSVGDNPYARYAALAEAENGQFSPAIPQFGADADGDPSVEKPDEALGADPSDLKFRCNVAVVFQLGK